MWCALKTKLLLGDYLYFQCTSIRDGTLRLTNDLHIVQSGFSHVSMAVTHRVVGIYRYRSAPARFCQEVIIDV